MLSIKAYYEDLLRIAMLTKNRYDIVITYNATAL